MTDVFVSYSRGDHERVSSIAQGLKETGFAVWWDRRLVGAEDFGMAIETALENSDCAVVAWSSEARNSLWVRAEANEAFEASKLVQLTLDGTRPPLPFTMLHYLTFASWSGRVPDPPWPELEAAVAAAASGELDLQPRERGPRARLAGFERQVAIGGASIALTILAAGAVGAAAADRFSADLFGLVAGGMFLAALVAFGHLLTELIKVSLASR